MWIHRISGTIILCLTIALSIYGIYIAGWEITNESAHNIIGMIVLLSVLEVALGGIFTRSRMVRLEWKTNAILFFKMIHKTGGFLLIALS